MVSTSKIYHFIGQDEIGFLITTEDLKITTDKVVFDNEKLINKIIEEEYNEWLEENNLLKINWC
ncbi:TPA: hypothetical protein PTV74_003198 [Clostridium botulinum]|nr:hypothetical protein [Clostridium botulinum]HDK7206353.1 hypothetical protein [Clostridium botulinum]HDK7210089.1 hypothetical protein [Clostridium botulinum]HDK7265538.1 hypothetical protein [Clostridium botulinum]HDK7269386.1 hypothetical protein [Clostridium botulinum]